MSSGGGVNVDFYKSQMLKQLDALDTKLLQNEYVRLVQQKTQVRPAFFSIGAVSLVTLFLVWGVGAQFVTNLIGFGYPLYESYRTLSLNQTHASTAALDSQWLTYWVIYGAFTLVESMTDFFLFWIPFYHVVKVGFLVWCFLPSTRGAEVVYHKVIEPVLVRWESRIDGVGRDTKRAVNRVVQDVASEVADAHRASVNDAKEPGAPQ